MASAGRILIMPKGTWSATIEYEMLDLVFNGDTSWLARKSSVGIEPSDANAEYWFQMCKATDLTEVLQRIAAIENQMVSVSLLDDEKLSNDKLGQSTISTDLLAQYDTPTFVSWNSTTLNTPYTEGLTNHKEGFAIVSGTPTTYHTIVAWTKGGSTINFWIHQVNGGTSLGWGTFLQSSGGTLTGDLKINKNNPRIQMKNETNSRQTIFEGGAEGYTSIGNWKANDDQVNLQIRKAADGLENLVRLTVNGDKSYKMFGEHNIALLMGLLGGIKLTTGSYTGKGYNGIDNKNSITFDFVPKIVLIDTNGAYDNPCIWHHGVDSLWMKVVSSNLSQEILFNLNNKTLEWYSVNEPNYQLNSASKTYHWVAIG
jgi:hypothetical protein